MGNILNDKLDQLYMEMAELISKQSYAERKKVGAVLVKDKNIISFGWNGTPSGFDNKCEDELGNTKKEVLHAESNAISKLAKYGGAGSENSTLYVTMSPCIECSKLIIQSGIKRVLYRELYRDSDPILLLEKAGILVEKL